MPLNWRDLSYLLTGTLRQQQAYHALATLHLPTALREFDPVLVGTIPLDVDVAGSDLDVIYEVPLPRQAAFATLVRTCYGHLAGFRQYSALVGGYESVISCFEHAGWVVELFGQARPTAQQPAYRHLVVEHAVLAAGGAAWRAAVRRLKQQGLKTEPAFAQLLGLPGNPYDALLGLEGESPSALQARLAASSLG